MNVKQHFQKHKGYYVGFAVGATSATGVYLALRSGDSQCVNTKITQILAYKPQATNKVVVEFLERSTPSKPIHLVGTDRYFASIGAAARETGISKATISQNVSGKIDNAKGLVFEALEIAE